LRNKPTIDSHRRSIYNYVYRSAYGRFDDLISINFVETLNEWIFLQAACDMFSEKNSRTFSKLAGLVLFILRDRYPLSTWVEEQKTQFCKK